jgi:hypothetical protein
MGRLPRVRGVRPDRVEDRDHFQDRAMCPVCGDELECGPGYVSCKVPSHYTRSVMSEDPLGEELRDEDGVAWGRLGADRHRRTNASFTGVDAPRMYVRIARSWPRPA